MYYFNPNGFKMDPPVPNCKNLKNLINMTSKVLLLKSLDFKNSIILQLFIELLISLYRIQMPLIHHHHPAVQITTHQIEFHRIFEDKEKQLQAIQRIPQLIYALISILPELIRKS
jgi:hypothetical protein